MSGHYLPSLSKRIQIARNGAVLVSILAALQYGAFGRLYIGTLMVLITAMIVMVVLMAAVGVWKEEE